MLSILRRKTLSLVQRRYASHFNADWRNGPYPQTEAQRLAAAKRYGLLPEDYVPFEESPINPGDYPNLRCVNEDHRNQWEDYDYYPDFNNYNEPQPYFMDYYFSCFADPDCFKESNMSRSRYWFEVLYPIAVLCIIVTVLKQAKRYPAKLKQYPFTEEVHYDYDGVHSSH